MSTTCVESSSSIKIMVPCDRVLAHIQSTLVGSFIEKKKFFGVWVHFFVAVPLVCTSPAIRKCFCGRMFLPSFGHFSWLYIRVRIADSRMVCEISTHEAAVPAPAVFRICGSVDSQKSSTRLNIALKICLLVMIQYITSSAQKDHRRVLS